MNKKILLVTGASSDIGCFLIKKVSNNYDLIIAHYNSSDKNLVELKSLLGEKLELIQADFSDKSSIEKFINKVEKFGCPNHIVHMPASKVFNERFDKSKWENLEKDLIIQLHSIYQITNKFIKTMSKTEDSKLLFVLSSYTINVPKYLVNYSTVKFALLGFMKALATEYAGKKITINAISPSMIETKFLENIPDLAIEQSALASPLRRNATVKDIVPFLEFLLLQESNYMHGQNLLLSGGSII